MNPQLKRQMIKNIIFPIRLECNLYQRVLLNKELHVEKYIRGKNRGRSLIKDLQRSHLREDIEIITSGLLI